ncbi:MAG: AAA family ATPase, partial [Chloroflexi bacterium]|nr:AAA family ATPase [Chloroflexota bacterium]
MQTKLYIPQSAATSSRRAIIPRLRLLQRLDATLHSKFMLVSAPTGFGKTTLVAAWLAQVTAVIPLWLSFDKNDNDPVRFLTYFIHALRGVEKGLGEAALLTLESSQTIPFEEVLTAVLNKIAQLTQPIVLVLDDFHLLTDPHVHEIVQFILQNQPPTFHLILVSRTDPPWPMARWRARGDMVELRGADLRFTLAETRLFLNDVMGFSLSSPQIEALDQRLEGWIAGLQMAALSMQGHKDSAGFIQAFTGSHRFILDYLMEEVLNQQPAAMQAFLMQSSVLDRFCGALCDAVLEREDSETVLVQLERSNLFLVPLDDHRRWFRYHHLFGELLYGRLQQTQPSTIRPLHHRASEWAAANNLIDEAVRYALAAKDVERVAQLIGENALAMAYHGELKTLLRWLRTLPDGMAKKRPWLNVAYAWALAFSGQLEAAELQLETAVHLVAKMPEPQQLTGYIPLIHAYCAGMRNNSIRTSEMANNALTHLPQDDAIARGMATLLLAIGQRMDGNLATSAALFAQVVTISETAKDHHLMVDVLWERAVLEFQQGQLHQVMASCKTALQLAHEYSVNSGRRLPVQGSIYERMSAVFTEWNELSTALHYAQEGVELSQLWGQADAIVSNNLRLTAVLLANGAIDQAQTFFRETRLLTTHLGKWYTLSVDALQAQLDLVQGKRETAVCWLRTCGLHHDDKINASYTYIYLRFASILMALDQTADALTLLSRLITIAETS